MSALLIIAVILASAWTAFIVLAEQMSKLIGWEVPSDWGYIVPPWLMVAAVALAWWGTR